MTNRYRTHGGAAGWWIVIVLASSFALAQTSYVDTHVDRCGPALDAAQRTADPADPAGRARIATALARVAFEALEPAYPAVRGGGGYADPDAAWLHARGFLPAGWSEDALNLDAWRELLARMQRPYQREPVPPSGRDDPDGLQADVQAALASGAAALRPLALIGVEPDGAGGRVVAFGTVIWNWTPRPRLLAFRLAGQPASDGDVASLLPQLGTCAWTPRSWATAPADLARDVYLGNVDAGLTILATPDRDEPGALPVASGDEETVFRLEAPAVADAPYVSLGFTGPGPTVGSVLRLAFSLRTNVGLFDVGTYLTIP